jgi:hypothetical protein
MTFPWSAAYKSTVCEHLTRDAHRSARRRRNPDRRCRMPQPWVECARQMSRLPYYIREGAFTRSGWEP